jgi:hypothetical protein
VAVRTIIALLPAKTAEAAEVLADISDVQVLVPDIGHRIPHALFAHFVCGGEDPVDLPVFCGEKAGCLGAGKPVAREDI